MWAKVKCLKSIHTQTPSVIYLNTENILVIDKTNNTIVMLDGSYWSLEETSMRELCQYGFELELNF